MGKKQCAHPACSCTVAEGNKYCSTYCEDAGQDEVEISCDCGHEPCALTKNRQASFGTGTATPAV